MNTHTLGALPAGVRPLTRQEEVAVVGGEAIIVVLGYALLVAGVAVALCVAAAVIGGVIYAATH